MQITIRKGTRKGACLAGSLGAALCMMSFLCAVPAPPAQAEGQASGGGQVAGSAAKKKIALVQFDVANTIHVDDINNIYDGFPSMLADRLGDGGKFLTVYTGRSIPAETGEAQREAIVQIATEAGAQFLISGTVVNAGVTRKKRSQEILPKRQIEVEYSVYDGITGARLLLGRWYAEARGDVTVGNDKPFGSMVFLGTQFGKATNLLINSAVKEIHEALKNVPFSANVIRVEASRAFLDAGADSMLKPGDQFVVYVKEAAPVAGLKGAVLGVAERAADIVTLTQVKPKFSIGELTEDAAKLGIRAGSIARIDPAEQSSLAAKQLEARLLAKAQQEAKEKAEREKAEQEAREKAEKLEKEQAARAEAARIKAEKKAQAEAKKQAAAEAKAARLKAAQEAREARIKAAREARARELAREKARAVAEARATRLKAQQEAKAEAARIKAEKKAQAEMEEARASAEAAAQQAAASGVAGAKTGAEAAAEAEPVIKKPGVPLKLKQIKP